MPRTNQISLSLDAFELATETLSWIELEKMGTTYAFSGALEQLNVRNKRDIDFAHKLVEETLRRINAIDRIIDSAIPEAVSVSLKIGIKSFLRMLVYLAQYYQGTRLTDLQTFLALARKSLGWKDLQLVEPFIGRLITTEIDEIAKNASTIARLALETFHPEWFVKYCLGIFGEKETDLLLRKNNALPPTHIRLNALRMSHDDILRELRKEGIIVKPEEGTKACFRVVSTRHRLASTQSYRQGLFHIQDKASVIAIEVASPRPGEVVLDLCSAPGSKSSFISEMMRNEGTIISIEKSPRRAQVQRTEMKRLGVDNVHIIVADATRTLPLRVEADLVILDPPCSNTGLFRRDPLSRWRVSLEDIDLFAKVQQDMTLNASYYVKKDGRLAYSSCSITIEENEKVIADFLAKRENFGGVNLYGFSRPLVKDMACCFRLFGHQHDSNGFFVALLRRIT